VAKVAKLILPKPFGVDKGKFIESFLMPQLYDGVLPGIFAAGEVDLRREGITARRALETCYLARDTM